MGIGENGHKTQTTQNSNLKSQNFTIRGSGIRAPSLDVRADQEAESMFSGITKGVRAPSRGVRTDYSGLPPRLVGVRTDCRGVRADLLLELENF